MKRIFALVLSFVFLLSCLVLPAGAMFDPSPVYQVQAASAYIVNTDTNIIVYDKDSTKQVSAGGLTKYMTLAVLLTNYADQLDNTFQMPFAISDYVYNTNNADMRSNETFTYREALYAMVTRNANEAAMGLAYALSGGDLAGWVSQMNTLSQRIGTTNSTWTDACGLDSGNVTTAVDMYLILRYLMSFDAFVEISSAPTFTMPAKEVTVSALFEKDAEQPTTGSYKDGTYTGSAKGHDSTVPVTVTVTVENGNISRIDVTKQNETEGYWAKAIAIIEKLLGLGNDSDVNDVKTISGATQSSTAIKEAVQNALKNAEEAGSESNPYVIANIDQLKAFADAVNKGNSYAGKYVVLGANLDLSEIAIWAPIGNSDHGKTNAFAGTFDGKGYTVSHVNCGKAGAAARPLASSVL